MPLDPRIALQVNAPEPIDVTRGFRLRAELEKQQRDAQAHKLAMEADQMKLEAAKRGMAKQAGVEGAFAQAGGDPEKALPGVMQADPAAGIKLRETLSKLKTDELQQSTAALQANIAKVRAAGDVLSSAYDQPTWAEARGRVKEMGVDVSKIPEQFNPQAAKFYSNMAMTRAQRATEAHQAAQLELQRRGQDISSETARFGQRASAETARMNREAAGERAQLDRNAAAGRFAATSAETARHNRAMENKARAPRDDRTSVQKEYEAAKAEGSFKGTLLDWMRERSPRPTTGTERQSLAYYNRAKEAVDTLANPDASGKSLEDRMAAQSLAGQGQLRYAPNILQTSEQQAYRQAQRAFTEARLRKESGAAIPQGEYENDARTYFAQPGDSPATIEQKRRARQTVLEGLGFAAGKAYEEFYGSPLAKGGGGPAPKGGPKPGDIEEGYRFKGGDPSKPSNWEKVK
jgi:hypothetical protein